MVLLKICRLILMLSLVALPLPGQTIDTWFIPADSDNAAGFGKAIALSGKHLLIGASDGQAGGIESGTVYHFEQTASGWQEQTKLTPADGEDYDSFGSSISFDNHLAAIGAPLNGERGFQTGSVYIFQQSENGWVEIAKLNASDADSEQQFGNPLVLSETHLAVGARLDNEKGFNAGAAYLFRHGDSGWQQEAKVFAKDAAAGDAFGVSLALDGNTLIVGAYLNDENGSESGAAYIFEYTGNTWRQTAKLLAGDGTAGDKFGYAVALRGDIAIVGAPRCDIDGKYDQGAVYVFERRNSLWREITKLTAADGGEFDYFGGALDMTETHIAIGANRTDNGDNLDQGAVYVFEKSGTGWRQSHKLTAGDGGTSSEFGAALALSKNSPSVFIYGISNTRTARVYVYDLIAP